MSPARRSPVRLVFVGIALAIGLATGLASARADRVYSKKGVMARGTVTRSETEIAVNKYRSTTGAMTYGVVRFPIADVKRIDEETDPEDIVRRRHRDLAPNDAVGRVGLAKFAMAQKVRFEGERLLEEALALDPAVPDGASLYGGLEKFQVAKKGNPALDRELSAALAGYLGIADGAMRAKEAARIAARFGMLPRSEYFERAWKSARIAKGLAPNVTARLRAEKHPGASYSLRIPETYDPFTPAPLLIALHDGGAGGKDGKSVVGRGRDADGLYAGEAERFGWIVVCPTAVVAPWSDPANDAWLLDVLEEVSATVHIDLDRVFLTGHGAGAAGVWAFASKHTSLLAGVAPTAPTAFGTAYKALRDGKLRVFLYASTDDSVAGPSFARADADALLDFGADVTYLELPIGGHSFPIDAEKEMFDLFARPRRFDAKRTSAWPTSSFGRPASADEKRDLGDPQAAWGTGSSGSGK